MSILARLALFIYGVGVIYGGYLGYHEKASTASLVAGSISGVVALVAFFLSFKKRALGFCLGILTAGAVGYMMIKRWLDEAAANRSYQDVPFIVGAASAVVVLLLIFALASGGKKKGPA